MRLRTQLMAYASLYTTIVIVCPFPLADSAVSRESAVPLARYLPRYLMIAVAVICVAGLYYYYLPQ